MVIADYLHARLDLAGAAIITAAAGIVAIYFATTFEVAVLTRLFGGTIANSASATKLGNSPALNNAPVQWRRQKPKQPNAPHAVMTSANQ